MRPSFSFLVILVLFSLLFLTAIKSATGSSDSDESDETSSPRVSPRSKPSEEASEEVHSGAGIFVPKECVILMYNIAPFALNVVGYVLTALVTFSKHFDDEKELQCQPATLTFCLSLALVTACRRLRLIQLVRRLDWYTIFPACLLRIHAILTLSGIIVSRICRPTLLSRHYYYGLSIGLLLAFLCAHLATVRSVAKRLAFHSILDITILCLWVTLLGLLYVMELFHM